MNQLHPDPNFHYEALRSIGLIRYGGGDIGEQLSILPGIKPNDPEGWYHAWHDLAQRVLETTNDTEAQTGTPSPTTLRDIYFKVSHYIFESDFFIHADWSDPRLFESWKMWRKYFDLANELLPNPGQHVSVSTSYGFSVPLIIYHAPGTVGPRPTMIIGGGFDSNYEETLHVFGFAALERGINVILYEGPGQPSLLHQQKQGFIHDWEKAVTPIMDYIETEQKMGNLAFIDAKKIGLLGMSMGGYLSARAAAFEPRLAALVCIDGVWSLYDCFAVVFPKAAAAFERGDVAECNAAFEDNFDANTNTRWIHDHSKFSFQVKTGYEIMEKASKMTLANGVAERIEIPVFIGEAEGDIFFGKQPRQVKDAVGGKGDLFVFGTKHAASAHCQSGALVYMNQKIFDWFSKVTDC